MRTDVRTMCEEACASSRDFHSIIDRPPGAIHRNKLYALYLCHWMNLSGYIARSLTIGSRFVGAPLSTLSFSHFPSSREPNFYMSMDAYQSQMVDGKQYISLTEKEVDETLIDKEKPLDDTVIPATVLQYERQMRKRRAANKAQGPVTREEHLKVVYEDDHLVVTDKPSGILCVPGIHHNPSLLTIVFDAYQPKDE